MKTLSSLVFACFIAFLSACGSGTGGSPSTDGSAGSPNTGGSDLGGNDGSAAGSQGGAGAGGGNSDVCHPSPAGYDNGCQNAKFCECLPMGNNTSEFCALMPAGACPEGGNFCTLDGVNACGYNLPLGETYSEPKCKEKINGDIWTDGDSDGAGPSSPAINTNGQFEVGFWSYSIGAPYYFGFIASGDKLYWNRANAAVAQSAEGVFAEDCETLTFYFYWPGETEPDPSTDEIYWMNEGQ